VGRFRYGSDAKMEKIRSCKKHICDGCNRSVHTGDDFYKYDDMLFCENCHRQNTLDYHAEEAQAGLI
jgi:hypothetical protein